MPTPLHPRTRFWVVETGPLAFVVSWGLARGGQDWQLVAALVGGIALSAGGVAARSFPRVGAGVATAGLGALLVALAPAITLRPILGLFLLLTSIVLVAGLWNARSIEELIGRREQRLRADVTDVRLAAAIALLTWLFGVMLRGQLDLWLAGASALASVLAASRALVWGHKILPNRAQAFWAALQASLALAAAIATASGALKMALMLLALMPLAALVSARIGAGVQIVDASWAGLILGHPARLVVITFLSLCVLGFALLSIPAASAGAVAVTRLDAAFTAVSAVCITGLTTVDTPQAWSNLGLVFLLLLMQLGGLGIMTLSTAALGILGRRLSVKHEEAVASLVSSTHRGLLFVALHRTLVVTFVVEAAGAIVLALLFWAHGDGLAEACWRGIFTAVSAFCNGGFALQPDSLISYQNSPAVLHTVSLLVIAGGLSPAVIVTLPLLARQQIVPMQVKVIVVASVGLLLFGFAMFLSIEWNQSLAGLSIFDRIHNAWFQSAMPRSGGFISVAFSDLHPTTIFLSLILMFVGGAPGGTAGGVKVTTIWVLGATVAMVLRGERTVTSFGRRISDDVVHRTIAIIAIGGIILVLILSAMLLTQPMAPTLAVFETFSAIGTVGLSVGGTAELDGLGKLIIMIAMFLGRVGPLTAFLLLVERQRKHEAVRLDENVEVG